MVIALFFLLVANGTADCGRAYVCRVPRGLAAIRQLCAVRYSSYRLLIRPFGPARSTGLSSGGNTDLPQGFFSSPSL